jgi:hypothetical protein
MPAPARAWESADGALHDSVLVIRAGSHVVLGFRQPEEHDAADAERMHLGARLPPGQTNSGRMNYAGSRRVSRTRLRRASVRRRRRRRCMGNGILSGL